MAKAKTIQFLALDVDGVLTDGRIVVNSLGEEAKCFNVKDGHGIVLALRAGLRIAWVSGRFSEVTNIRARELGVGMVVQGEGSKLAVVKRLAGELAIPMENVAFIGDDVVDLDAMGAVGLPIAVADALPEVIGAAVWVTCAKGGHGAVREILDMVRRAKDK
jgi:3-deoxy-D-manno-octulosonate 8-phosphate phosphatase (KDO 8-P phosphatase)